MSLAFTRLSPTPIVQTLHHSPSAAEVALWSRYPEAPFVAISNEQARLLSRRSTSSARCCTASTPTRSRSARRRTTTCCSSAASPKARACCRRSRSRKRVGMRLILAAAEDDYYREKVAPHVDGTPDRLPRRGRLRGEGEALRRRARAALSRSRRASRSASCSPRRWRAARRSPRSIAAPCARSSTRRHRASSSTISSRWSTGLPRVFDARSAARPRARRRALRRRAHGRRVRRRSTAGSCEAHRGRREPDDAAGRPDAPRRLRPPRRRVAGVRRHAGAAGRRRRPRRRCSAPRAASADRSATRRSCTDGDLGGVRARRAARGRARSLGIADVHRARSPRRRSALGRRARAPRRDRRGHRAATGRTPSSRSARTACTGTSITSASTSGRTRPCGRSAPTRRRSTTSRCRRA